MTDDQTVADLAAMPRTHALLGAGGVTFDRSYVSYPVCCPSRATSLSGQYAHNHGVMGLHPPTGGYARFDAQESLPVWLQRSGYRTAHVGKYLNGYGTDTPADVPPAGATGTARWATRPTACGASRSTRTATLEDLRRALRRGPGELPDRRSGREGGGADRATAPAAPARCSCRWPSSPPTTRAAPCAGHRAHRAARAAPHGRLAGKHFPARARFNERDMSDKPFFLRRRPRLDALGAGLASSTTTARARSRCWRSTRRWWTSWTRCARTASSTTPTSSSPPTTASCRASTACRAARCCPTTLPPRCRC